AEKEQMVRDGKLKKRDIANDSIIYKGDDNCYYEKLNNLSEIKIETEVTLPQNWELCRLNTIALINPKNNIDDNMDVGFIPMDHIEQGYQTKYRFQTKKWKDIKKGYTHFAKNDIIVAKISPCFENRKSAILNVLPNMYGAGTTELYVIRVSNKYIYNKYILWLLKSNYFIKQGYNSYTGTVGQQRISKDLIPNLLIPLPSYNEQLRIVKCITNAKKLLDEI
ncbi:restriction endonuclease subunit S, partial [bacterium]|nr:restriction endonuclease subunit S [bacterium]